MICLTHINTIIMKSLFAFIIIITLISCGDNGPNCPGDILLPINISPNKLFYNLGDTITISSKFHKLLYDQKTDKYYDASNYKFRPSISFLALDISDEKNVLSQVNEYCDFIKLDSSKMNVFYPGIESAIVGDYTLSKDSLGFVIKLKLKKSGYFWLKIESLTSGDSHLQNNYQFNCRGRYIDFDLVAPKESGIYLLHKFRFIQSNDWILSDSIHRFYNHAGYCFEVR